jgi:pseudouridine-5'-phosphate glycosidase
MVTVSDLVTEALSNGDPVVALETAVLTSGIPRTTWQSEYGICPDCIDASQPINQSLAHAVTLNVSTNGALPVWIGVIEGVLKIGLSQDEIETLCMIENATKVSLATISQAINQGVSAGTTVATTLLGCKVASQDNPIRVFATGGIGGMHIDWSNRFDVSADLTALATTPTCVVASGAKSILDLHATVEVLETIGVPTLGIGCDTFPPFIESLDEHDPQICRVESPLSVAEICKTHWRTLGLNTSILATVPVPSDAAVKRGSLVVSLKEAESRWLEQGRPSKTRTPYLLNELAIITQGRTLKANLELLRNNATVASEIAVAMAST